MTIFEDNVTTEVLLQYLRERTGMILFNSEFSGVVGESGLFVLLDKLVEQGLLQYHKTHVKAFMVDSVA
ncbi:TPA: hypothetical protein ACM99T_000654 [Escherichia coli]